MRVIDVILLKEDSGWFVVIDSKMGPYPRELAESLARGKAFAIRTSGEEARIVFGEPGEPGSDIKDWL